MHHCTTFPFSNITKFCVSVSQINVSLANTSEDSILSVLSVFIFESLNVENIERLLRSLKANITTTEIKNLYGCFITLGAHSIPSIMKSVMMEYTVVETKKLYEYLKTTSNPDFNNLRKISRVLIPSLNIELKRQLKARKRNWLLNNGFITYIFILSKTILPLPKLNKQTKTKKLNFINGFETAKNLTDLNLKNVVYIICSLTDQKIIYIGDTGN